MINTCYEGGSITRRTASSRMVPFYWRALLISIHSKRRALLGKAEGRLMGKAKCQVSDGGERLLYNS